MADVEVNLNGVDALNDALARLQRKLRDLRSVWPQVAAVFYFAMQRQFGTEGAYAGNGWAPLSPAYASWKERKHPGLPIMQLTGRLRTSLTDARGNSDSIYEYNEDTLIVGTRTHYARYHQYGTGMMPARPLLALTAYDKAQMVRIIRDSFGNEATQLGFQVRTRYY